MLKMISSSSNSAVATGITLAGVDFAYFAPTWEIEYLERERGYPQAIVDCPSGFRCNRVKEFLTNPTSSRWSKVDECHFWTHNNTHT
jgi:hypothetical protein